MERKGLPAAAGPVRSRRRSKERKRSGHGRTSQLTSLTHHPSGVGWMISTQ